jgi:thioredoxin 1
LNDQHALHSPITMNTEYTDNEPTRTAIDELQGPAVLEFGTGWCGFCRSAQPLIATAFANHPGVRHFKIEDGKGRRLGRSFQVKLWPTLIFLRDGQEVSRLVRPATAQSIGDALKAIARD